MIRRTLRFQLSQGDAPEGSASKKKAGKCGGARNHHITEFFKPPSRPETDALVSALRETVCSQSMKLQTPGGGSWNEKSATCQRPRIIPTSSTNERPSSEPSLSVRTEDQKIVRKFEEFCPKCGKSLLFPRVLLQRLTLNVNSQVYLEDKEGYKIFSDNFQTVRISSDSSLHSSSPKFGSRSKHSLTVLGSACQTIMRRQNKCCPLKSLNLLRSDLQVPLDFGQDEITWKKYMNPVVNLGKNWCNQVGQQVKSTSSALKRKLDSQNGSFTEWCRTPKMSKIDEDFNHLLTSVAAPSECNRHGNNASHSCQKSADLETGPSVPGLAKPDLSHNTESGNPLSGASVLTKEIVWHESPLCGKPSSPGKSSDVSPAHSDRSSIPDSDEVSENKLKKGTSCRALCRVSDSDESFVGFPLSSDDEKEEEEEAFKPLDEIFQMTRKPLPATPQKYILDHSLASLSPASLLGTPAIKNVKPSVYDNNLDRLVKEQEECKRLDEMEKLLHEDLERGLGVANEQEDSAEEGELTEWHREFLDKFKFVTNAIPDQHPGEEVFHLPESGAIFSLRKLDLRHSEFSPESAEENLIFSCSPENQITLATEGFLTFLYRFKKCPDFLMRWMFQVVSIHPSYAVSVKLLHTLIEICCTHLQNLQEKPWTPSLLDIATVFANMGIRFDTLFPLPHIQPLFGSTDMGPALPLDGLQESRCSEPIFSHIPEFQIAHVIKFLGFCSAICRESFCDLEILALIVLLLKLHLEKDLKDFPTMDLHCLIEALLQNIKSWDKVMPEMFYAISELSSHHHNCIKLLQLIPTTENRGRQLRKHLSLIYLCNILEGNCTGVPLDYDSQMLLLSRLMSQMRPSSLVKKMQKLPENESKTTLDLDQEAYYLTFSLLHLVNDASSSDMPPSKQRKYLQKLCIELEKYIKSDIREDARYFYRTKVKDLVARIHGRWQELLLYSQPNQGKLRDYWEPVGDSSSPQSSQENADCALQDFPYDDN
ncbi:SMC5-SMC6 complex localization factor protein 2 isoform X1 [Bufo gargarizans]|uniref:SMC5-SMC6 complex localization factor protein 2 isoform X1 n=1 Tax=Bufo gargarizans TaxID=30331 RepID=UPI001CF0F687|nr:SMC5-SMC6 complex localization factor protein 2 isoform X1 [Bufo gargarizans]